MEQHLAPGVAIGNIAGGAARGIRNITRNTEAPRPPTATMKNPPRVPKTVAANPRIIGPIRRNETRRAPKKKRNRRQQRQ